MKLRVNDEARFKKQAWQIRHACLLQPGVVLFFLTQLGVSLNFLVYESVELSDALFFFLLKLI